MNTDNVFIWEAQVRDNELDFQGIVNNANYFVYMAESRHKHLKHLGIDIIDMHQRGFDLVLVRTELDFQGSLKGGDSFLVTSKLAMMGRIRIVFTQQVIRKSDQKVMASAKNIGTCIACSTGRPVIPDELKTILS